MTDAPPETSEKPRPQRRRGRRGPLIPPPKMITWRIDESLKNKVDAKAAQCGLSVNCWLTGIIEQLLDEVSDAAST